MEQKREIKQLQKILARVSFHFQKKSPQVPRTIKRRHGNPTQRLHNNVPFHTNLDSRLKWPRGIQRCAIFLSLYNQLIRTGRLERSSTSTDLLAPAKEKALKNCQNMGNISFFIYQFNQFFYFSALISLVEISASCLTNVNSCSQCSTFSRIFTIIVYVIS